MMKFPRKADGTPDFEEFSKIPDKAKKKDAFKDLQDNGSMPERRAFQTFIRTETAAQQQTIKDNQAKIAVLENKMQALQVTENKITGELKGRVSAHVGAQFKNYSNQDKAKQPQVQSSGAAPKAGLS